MDVLKVSISPYCLIKFTKVLYYYKCYQFSLDMFGRDDHEFDYIRLVVYIRV